MPTQRLRDRVLAMYADVQVVPLGLELELFTPACRRPIEPLLGHPCMSKGFFSNQSRREYPIDGEDGEDEKVEEEEEDDKTSAKQKSARRRRRRGRSGHIGRNTKLESTPPPNPIFPASASSPSLPSSLPLPLPPYYPFSCLLPGPLPSVGVPASRS